MPHGILLIAIASVLLATNTNMAKFAYMGGLTAPVLLLVRYLAGATAFSTYLRLRGLPIRPPGALWRTLGAAGINLTVSLLFLGAASRIPLSLAVVLVFTYPAWTVLVAHLLKMERITLRKSAAVLMALAGIGLAVGPDFSQLDTLGVLMAAAAGITFSLVPTVARQISRGVDPIQVNAFVAFLGIPITLGLALVGGEGRLTLPDTVGVWLPTLGSALFYILGFGLLLTGIAQTEPTRASVTQTLEPLTTVALAVLVLGEPLNPLQLVGAVLILAAILTVALAPAAPASSEAAALSGGTLLVLGLSPSRRKN